MAQLVRIQPIRLRVFLSKEVPWAVKDRCGKSTAERGVHTISLNFSPFTKLVSTEAIPDFFSNIAYPSPSPLQSGDTVLLLREAGELCIFYSI